ncbi:MAG: ArdC-like ssDNA-binding domain-containing protein [Firmicutes bacterium]|nr:ArdC-like ssDNA-binding domain-containing protein [Bacillota bacterium]
MAEFDDLLGSQQPQEAPPMPEQPLDKEAYAAQKKEQREALFTLADETTLAVAADPAMFVQYLDTQARLDRYSATNVLLVMAQKPEATQLGSFDHWKQQRCSVQSGQTGISVLEPHRYTKEDGSPGTGYNVKKVFDVSQVDTRRLKPAPAPQCNERQLLAALIAASPVKVFGVDEMPDGSKMMIDPDSGAITVQRGIGFTDTFCCVAQGVTAAHLSGGPDSQMSTDFSAQCATYMLCKKYGVDTQSFDFSRADKVFSGQDAQAVKGELTQIRDAAEDISRLMSPQLEAPAKKQEARE